MKGALSRPPHHAVSVDGGARAVLSTVRRLTHAAWSRSDALVEHVLGRRHRSGRMAALPSSGGVAGSDDVSVTDKLHSVLTVLRLQTGREGYTLDELQERTRMSLVSDNRLVLSLRQNSKVSYNEYTGRFSYKSEISGESKVDMLRQLRQRGSAAVAELEDAYPTARHDVDVLSSSGGFPLPAEGGLIRVLHARGGEKSDMAFHRPDLVSAGSDVPMSQLVRLSGTLHLVSGSRNARTSADLTLELFRNDLVLIEGRAFRVSSEPVAALGMSHTEALAAAAAAAAAPVARAGAKRPREEVDQAAAEEGDDDVRDYDGEDAALFATVSRPALPGGFHRTTGPIVYTTSAGNGLRQTGGKFSVADTGPHQLKTGMAYAHAFTATVLPLDHAWDGPDMHAAIAYRVGASADLRALWRLMVTHGHDDIADATGFFMQRQMAAQAAAMVSAAATHSSATASSTLNAAADAVAAASMRHFMHQLGSVDTFRNLRTFPATHRELRREMKAAGLGESPMKPGTLEGEDPLVTAKRVRSQRVRRPNERALVIQSNEHIMASGSEQARTLEQIRRVQVVEEYQRAKALMNETAPPPAAAGR